MHQHYLTIKAPLKIYYAKRLLRWPRPVGTPASALRPPCILMEPGLVAIFRGAHKLLSQFSAAESALVQITGRKIVRGTAAAFADMTDIALSALSGKHAC